MVYQLQMLRELITRHPEQAGSLTLHVTSLERSIDESPLHCLSHVRTLFEAAQATIASKFALEFGDDEGLPQRNKKIIKSLDLSLKDHPESDKIDKQLKALLGNMNGATSALATLSNIPNMRHGAGLDLPTLERQHAYMLGGLCDALVSFLLDVAWSRKSDEEDKDSGPWYEEEVDFNDSIDNDHPLVKIVGSVFEPSFVLFKLDPTKYESALDEWRLTAADTEQDVAA